MRAGCRMESHCLRSARMGIDCELFAVCCLRGLCPCACALILRRRCLCSWSFERAGLGDGSCSLAVQSQNRFQFGPEEKSRIFG